MGVNHLWSIIAPVKTHKPLKSLKGQTLAVDLSVWICESATALQGLPVVKPHLRNLFFRVTNLTQLGVNLIFILDGEPPELKWEEMQRRTKARFEGGGRWGRRSRKRGGAGGGATAGGAVEPKGGKKKMGRTRFQFVVKECAEMLGNLGIPCVQAAGEAEAMCALLNERGLVDACLTVDGDVFLYGARTVYKNFALNTKDPHIECYTMDDIESQLGLDQSKLIALALLLGCDYTPGVSGIGQKQALGLMSQVGPGVDVLERFRDWADGRIPKECLEKAVPTKLPHCTKCTHVGSGKEHRVYGCAMCKSDFACRPKSAETPQCTCPWHTSARSKGMPSVERDVMKKACVIPDFPSEPVIEEFLYTRDKCPQEKFTWKRPQLISAQKFISAKLEWPEDYTVEKVFPLLTLWDLKAVASGHSFDPTLHTRPTAVIKKRVRQGVACVEIQWQTAIPHSELEFPVTIERQDLFQKAFPELMRTFEEEKASKTKHKRKRAVKSRKDSAEDAVSQSHPQVSSDGDLDGLTSAIAELSLISHPSTLTEDIESRSSEVNESHLSNSHMSREGACLAISSRRNQRAKGSSKCLSKCISIETPHLEPSTMVFSKVGSDSEILDSIVRKRNIRSNSTSAIKVDVRRPLLKKKHSQISSRSDVFDKEYDELLNPQDQCLIMTSKECIAFSSSAASNTTTASFQRIIGKPLNRKPSRNIPHFAASIANVSGSSTNDFEAEPLPLSERLRLNRVIQMETIHDSSISSLAEKVTKETSLPVAASSLSEQLQHKKVLETESVEDSSSSSSGEEVNDNTLPLSVDTSSMEWLQLKKALETNSPDISLSVENVTDDTSSLPVDASTLFDQLQLKKVLKTESLEAWSSSSSSSLSSVEEVADDTSSLPVDVLSLSERLQLKELLETESLEDSLSVASVEEVSDSTLPLPVDASSLVEQLWIKKAVETECQEDSSSSVKEMSPVDMSSLFERLQLKNIPTTKTFLNLSASSSVKEVTDDLSSLPEDASSLMEGLQLKKVLNTESPSSLSVEITGDAPLLPVDVSSLFSLGSPDNANFTLGFELTNLLSHDESLQQLISLEKEPDGEIQSLLLFRDVDQRVEVRTCLSPTLQEDSSSNVSIHKEFTNYTQNPAVPRKSQQKQSTAHSPPSCPSSAKYHPNFSLEFELTNILDEDESLLYNEVSVRDDRTKREQTENATRRSSDNPRLDRDDVSMQTPPVNLCQTAAPVPIDVDTPSMMGQSSLKVFDQSGHFKLFRTENPCHLIKTPASRVRVHCQSKVLSLDKENRANHSPASPLTSQSGHISLEEENSPISLLDRIKRKHGNQKGVLSAVLSMKNGGKLEGKRDKGRKVLVEIFNDGNDDDSVIIY